MNHDHYDAWEADERATRLEAWRAAGDGVPHQCDVCGRTEPRTFHTHTRDDTPAGPSGLQYCPGTPQPVRSNP